MTDKTALLALIDRYWDLAYDEGREGRTHDTADGAAAKCRHEIGEAIEALAEQPAGAVASKHAVAFVGSDGRPAWINPDWPEVPPIGGLLYAAPPAASAELAALREFYNASMAHNATGASTRRLHAAIDAVRAIDSAGGAKGPREVSADAIGRGDLHDMHNGKAIITHDTPQPDGGDGAVACPRCGAPCTTTEEGCVDPMLGDMRYTAYHYTAPSAAAVVPDLMVQTALRNLPQYIGKSGLVGPDKQSAMLCFETLRDALAAAPAAPKGGVVVVAREIAEKVQDALGRFVGDEGWCGADMETADAFSAALANREQRHDAIADDEAGSA